MLIFRGVGFYVVRLQQLHSSVPSWDASKTDFKGLATGTGSLW